MSTDSYESRLAQRLTDMQKAWQVFLDGDLSAVNLLQKHSHQLSGSAALYGYAELGESALYLHTVLDTEGYDFVVARDAWEALQTAIVTVLKASHL